MRLPSIPAAVIAVALLGCDGAPRRGEDAGSLLFPAAYDSTLTNRPPPRCTQDPRRPAPAWLVAALDPPACGDSVREALRATGHDEGDRRRAAQARLTAASLCDDRAALQAALDDGADPNGIDPCGTTALVAAASAGAHGAVRLLLDARADPDVPSRQGPWSRSPLLAALARRDAATARLLLDAGADARATSPAGRGALHLAAAMRDDELVRVLLRRGAERSQRDRLGLDAAGVAAVWGDEDLARLLGARLGAPGDKRERKRESRREGSR